VTSGDKYYTKDVENYNQFDLNRAKQLVAELGWMPGSDGILTKNGVRMEFSLVIQAESQNQQLGSVIQAQLHELGMNVNVQAFDRGTYFGKLFGTPAPDAFMFFYLWPVPIDVVILFVGTGNSPNWQKASIPSVDAAIQAWQQASNEDELRLAGATFQVEVARNLPIIPLAYLARRGGRMLLILLLSSIAIFYSLRFAPGDPVGVVLNPLALKEVRDAYRERVGLNQPIYLQYVVYISNMARGNLGVSLVNGTPMLELLAKYGTNSLILGLAAVLVSYLIGIPLGVIAAAKRNTWIDQLATGVGILGMGIPNFWLALLLVYLFSFQLKLLPSAGCCSLQHLIMPTIVLAAEGTAVTMRMMRSSMLEHL